MTWRKISLTTGGEVYINLEQTQYMIPMSGKTVIRMNGEKKFYSKMTPEEIFSSEEYFED